MKKYIIAIVVSSFIFCLFTGLSTFAAITNIYGINIDNTGIFPKIEITGLENPHLRNETEFSTKGSLDSLSGYVITNNTGKIINIMQYDNYYQQIEGEYSLRVDSIETMYKVEDKNINLIAAPEEYDVYVGRYLYFSTETPKVYLNIIEEDTGSSEVDQEYLSFESAMNTITLKDGESYEIKLPE